MRMILAFLCVWPALLGPAFAAPLRTWTDVHGNQTSASFVRVHDGTVILMRGNSPLRLPFERFSPEDQQHIRELLEAEGKGHLLPSPRPRGGGGAEPNEAPPRLWTDLHGNRLTGRLIKVEGPNAYLEVDGQTKSYPISGFSLADQDEIRNWTAQNGGGQLRADAPNRMTADQMHAELVRRQKESVLNRQESGEPTAGMTGGQNLGMSERPEEMQVSSHRSPANDDQSNRWPQSPRWDHAPGDAGHATPSDEPQDSIARQNTLLAEREAWKRYQNDRNAPIPNLVVSNCTRACTKCGRPVPDYAELGQRCPGCGIVWEAAFDHTGKVIDRKATAKGIGQICAGVISLIGMIWGLVSIVRAIRGGSG